MLGSVKKSTAKRELHYLGEPFPLEQLENIPHLHNLARQIREVIHANKTFRDIELQNKLIYENFVARFNSDLVFRLLITKEYYLLSSLFKDPKEKAKWIKFLDELRRSDREDHQRQIAPATIIVKADTNKLPIYAASGQPQFSWNHPSPNLTNIEKWQHYEKELQRLTFNYHIQKVHVHNKLLESDLQCIEQMKEMLDTSDDANKQAFEELSLIAQNIKLKQQEILRIPLKEDGTFDIQAVAQQDEKITLLQKELSEKMEQFFSKFGTKNSEIGAMRSNYMAQKQPYLAELKNIDITYKEQSTGLKKCIAGVSSASKEDINNSLITSIETIKQINHSVLDKKQSSRIAHSIKDLEDLKVSIAQSTDPYHIQRLLIASGKKLSILIEVLPVESSNKIKTDLESLKKLAGSNVLNPTSDAPHHFYNLDSKLLQQEKMEHTNQNTSKTMGTDTHQDDQSSIDYQKTSFHAMKNAYRDIINSSNPVNAIFKESLKTILENLEEEEIKYPFSNEEQDLIQVIKEKITNTTIGNNNQSILSLYDDLETLVDQCARLSDIKGLLESVLEEIKPQLLEYNAHNQVKL